jgi:heavy metal sensor kinase
VTPRSSRTIRTRLTLWYVAVLAAIVVIYTAVAGVLQYWQLTRQIYHDQVQDMETVEALLFFTPDGRLDLRQDYLSTPAHRLLIDRLMEVLSPAGEILYRNERTGTLDLGGPRRPGEGKASFDTRRLRLANGVRVQLISHVHSVDGHPLLIRLAYSLDPVYDRMRRFFLILGLAMPLALAAAAVAGQGLARRALSPLEHIARQTAQITATRLGDRLALDNPDDELGHIAYVVNNLLSRLEASFEQLTQFSSDVAHELRTPLAAIRSVGEVGLQQERTPEAYREIIGSMLEETSRLTELIDGLLMMSRTESTNVGATLSAVRLADIVQEAAGLVEILAQEQRTTIEIIETADTMVEADSLLLRLAVVNVLHNAIKYSPGGGQIMVRLGATQRETSQLVRAEIHDQGPGIAEADRERVFERFYRVDTARSRDAGGIGLGLAIARWAISRCNGTIRFEHPDHPGARCVIELPAVPRPA